MTRLSFPAWLGVPTETIQVLETMQAHALRLSTPLMIRSVPSSTQEKCFMPRDLLGQGVC